MKNIILANFNSQYYSDLIIINETSVVETNLQSVNIGYILGTFKGDFESYKLLEVAKKELLKNINIKLYKSRKLFEVYLSSDLYLQMPITLIKIRKYYYVFNDGNYRIVMAKLVGIENLKAVVVEVNREEEKRIMELLKI